MGSQNPIHQILYGTFLDVSLLNKNSNFGGVLKCVFEDFFSKMKKKIISNLTNHNTENFYFSEVIFPCIDF
jgi:hypothetical protein